jgi:hypothetical protein
MLWLMVNGQFFLQLVEDFPINVQVSELWSAVVRSVSLKSSFCLNSACAVPLPPANVCEKQDSTDAHGRIRMRDDFTIETKRNVGARVGYHCSNPAYQDKPVDLSLMLQKH